MPKRTELTDRQRFWLQHIRRCGSGSLKAYAEANGLAVSALYEAKSRLKRAGALARPPARFVRVQRDSSAPTLCRIHLRNGAVVEVACEAERWPELLQSVAALP